jgi:hypothetical protein
MDGVKEVAGALETMTGDMGGLAVLVAGIGALSMAVVEALKSMLPLRAYFHRGEIERWLKGEHLSTDARLMGIGFDDLPSAVDADAAFNELLRLAIGGTSYQTALFEQAPEKMFGQIQAGANVAMDFPTIAPNLYEFLTHEAGSERVGATRALQKAQKPGDPSDQEVWSRFTEALHGGQVDPKTDDPAKKKEYLDANQARQRLDNLVRRRLDALQSRVTYRWGRYNQFAAFFTAVGFSVAALVQVPKLSALSIAVLAVAAGFLAPPAKDLAAALSNIRYR